MKKAQIRLLENWPAQSPDLSPIENIWGYVAYKIKDRKCSNVRELWSLIQKAWNEIPRDMLLHLYDSMSDRLRLVRKSHGDSIKY